MLSSVSGYERNNIFFSRMSLEELKTRVKTAPESAGVGIKQDKPDFVVTGIGKKGTEAFEEGYPVILNGYWTDGRMPRKSSIRIFVNKNGYCDDFSMTGFADHNGSRVKLSYA